MEIRKRFALRVATLREERGWTQEDLAHASGLSTRSISNIENSVYSVTLDTIGKLASGFELQPRELLDF